MIEFNAGTFKGEGKLMKLSTYRDGGLGFPIRVNNNPEAAVLLANVNKICRFTFEAETGNAYQGEGELVKLSTYKNGGIGLDVVVPNEPRGGAFLLAHDKKSGQVTFEFSSVKGKIAAPSSEEDEEDEEIGQQALDFMSQAAEDGGPTEGVDPKAKPTKVKKEKAAE